MPSLVHAAPFNEPPQTHDAPQVRAVAVPNTGKVQPHKGPQLELPKYTTNHHRRRCRLSVMLRLVPVAVPKKPRMSIAVAEGSCQRPDPRQPPRRSLAPLTAAISAPRVSGNGPQTCALNIGLLNKIGLTWLWGLWRVECTACAAVFNTLSPHTPEHQSQCSDAQRKFPCTCAMPFP